MLQFVCMAALREILLRTFVIILLAIKHIAVNMRVVVNKKNLILLIY